MEMPPQKEPFWKKKSLGEMSREEWESLCDGCGICCLEKTEDDETGEIEILPVACPLLDIETCRCTVYALRASLNPECIDMGPDDIGDIPWLPDTCAYRRVAEGRDLEPWHILVSGDPEAVHREGISIRRKVLSGRHIRPEDLHGRE